MKRFTAKPIMASDTKERVTLQVEYEPYDRYVSSGLRKAKVSGNTLLEALSRMVDKLSLYINSDDIEEQNMSSADVIEEIEASNGDGCDFILSLVNTATGEKYIDLDYDEYFDTEDWDDDYE